MNSGFGILDAQAAMEKIFPGCTVEKPITTGHSFIAEIRFYEYEIRVILFGGKSPNRDIHYRFLQRPGGERHKIILKEVYTDDPEELLQALRETRSHVMGVLHALHSALMPKGVPKIESVDAMLNQFGS